MVNDNLALENFTREAEKVACEKLAELKQLSFREALSLPPATPEDIVIAGKETQLTVFRQSEMVTLPDAVLITVQLVRAGLGGILNFHHEQGLVYRATGEIREATEGELQTTG